jgi:hypothetical protein
MLFHRTESQLDILKKKEQELALEVNIAAKSQVLNQTITK